MAKAAKEPDHLIVGVHVKDRLKKAGVVQDLLTEYGCNIKTRLGLHHVDRNFCSSRGLILLETAGDQKECRALVKKLRAVKGVEVRSMVFKH